MSELHYQSGFGNQFVSEAVPGTLPVGRNSPQKVARGLYAELLSGSAFTAPRVENRRTWMYRRQPSVVVAGTAYEPYPHATWKTGAAMGVATPPNPMRWHPVPIPADRPRDFIDGLHTIVSMATPMRRPAWPRTWCCATPRCSAPSSTPTARC
jgi:homogentisate 1,2-dioxygenase